MAFALGFAGGFADAVEAPPEAPPPQTVGGGAIIVSRRWQPVAAPKPYPARVQVRARVTWRWSARVTSVAPPLRIATVPTLKLRPASLTIWPAPMIGTFVTKVAVADVNIDPIALARFTYETRELNEIAVALAAWD